MSQAIVSPSTVLPLALEEVKDHLRLDTDDEDALLLSYLRAETEYAEGYLNRSLITQTRDYFTGAWPASGKIELPRSPLVSVTSVTYKQEGTTSYGTTFSSTKYDVDTASEPGRIVLRVNESWPSDTLEAADPIRVRYVSGYGSRGSDVPERIRTAILLGVGDLYENREDTVAGSVTPTMAVRRLLHPLRVYRVP